MIRKTPFDIFYETFECTNPCADYLILLMGVGGGRLSWPMEMIEVLRSKTNVAIVDNRGTGQSSKPRGADSYSIDAMARDLIQVIKDLGSYRYHVLGYSMGGCIAQEAIRLFDNFMSMILVSTKCGGKDYAEPAEGTLETITNLPGDTAMDKTLSS